MNFTVNGVRFWEMLWNLTLFANKTGVTKGEVYLRIDPIKKTLYAIACDDFIIVQDQVSIVGSDLKYHDFTLDNPSLKILEKLGKEWKFDVLVKHEDATLTVAAETYQTDVPESEIWSTLQDLANLDTPALNASDFYINPDRFKNIPRMKIEGHLPKDQQDHPVALRYVKNDDDEVMLAFLYGNSVRGMITSMSPETLVQRGVKTWAIDQPQTEEEDTAMWEAEGYQAEDPPWDVDAPEFTAEHDVLQGVKARDYLPENVTTRVTYTNPVDPEAIPDHVDTEEYLEYGY